MFSVKPLLMAAALGGAAVAMVAPDVAKAGTVVASSGPSAAKYPVGKKLKDTDRITLRANDSVTVLDSKGTRVISGPGTHMVGARGTSKRSTFAALTRQRSGARSRTGAVRGGPTSGSAKRNLWQVNVAQGGNFCVPGTSSVQLWRPGGEGKATYNISQTDSATHMHVTFEDGAQTVALDTARMPISTDMPYVISGPDGGSPVTVNFTMLDTVPRDAETMASDLIAKGCKGQLDLLSSTMMIS